MNKFPLLILLATAYDLVCMWLRRFDVDHEEYCYLPDGLIRWGSIVDGRGKFISRYFFVRFPFISQWKADYCRDVLCWHTPILIRARGQWHVWWESVR